MALDEDYRTLIEEARDAVIKLLDESEPDAWLALRHGYGSLRDALLRDDQDRGRDEIQTQTGDGEAREWDPDREWRERLCQGREEWKGTPMAYKEGLVIEAVGEEHVTVHDLVDRLNENLGLAFETGFSLFRSHVESIVGRLLASGQLDRVKLPVGAREVWHYFRPRDLEGPIADLERAYHAEED